MFKGSAWYADANRNSLITLGNGGGETTEVAAVLYFNGGTGQYEVRQQLAPGRQMWIDVAQLIRAQMPDAEGRTIPLEVTTGSYELRAVKQTGVGNLFEGKLTIDKTYGYAAYGCAVQCCWYDPTINPNPFTSPVGTGGQDTAWSECSANGLLYDVTSNTNPWSSTNTSVATLSGIGYVNLVGAGSSTINTSIYLDSILKPYCKPSLRPGSGGANGTNPIFDVAYSAYIPVDHVDSPTECLYFGSIPLIYKGDANRGTYRATESIRIAPATRTAQHFFANTGVTNNYGALSPINGTILSAGDEDGIRYDCLLWNNMGQAIPDFSYEASFTEANKVTVRLYGQTSNPLEPPAPIQWDMNSTLDISNSSSMTVRLDYNHSCYPAHQIKVNDQIVYLYTPLANDPSYLFNCLALHLDAVTGTTTAVVQPR